MKKISISIFLVLIFVRVQSQNTYNVTVQANNIRVWNNPMSNAVTPNTYLKFGEKIRIINAVIADKYDKGGNRFCRIYKDENYDKPYYLNLGELVLDIDNLLLLPSRNAIISERSLNYFCSGDNFTIHNPGEIIFFDGKNSKGIYTYLNKAAVQFNKSATVEHSGFYVVKNIQEYSVEGKQKIFLLAFPQNSPFNNQKDSAIYIDFNEAYKNIDFHTLKTPNYLYNLMLRYAYKYPRVNNTPNEFYLDYLNTLYGETVVNVMDEFKRNKLLNNGKEFMDSIYKTRLEIYNSNIIERYTAVISDYDFQNNSFKLIDFSDGDEIFDQLKFKVVEVGENNFWPKGSVPLYDLLNLGLFPKEISMKEDSAELFLKEIKSNPIDNIGRRKIFLVPSFKFISEENAESFFRKTGVKKTFKNIYKYIDHIDVYTGALSFKKETNTKWATLYPKVVGKTRF